MIIKVCGLNNSENINQLMKLDLDFMGIIFYEKSSRFFSSAVLPKSEKKYVAVFVDESLEVIKKLINTGIIVLYILKRLFIKIIT